MPQPEVQQNQPAATVAKHSTKAYTNLRVTSLGCIFSKKLRRRSAAELNVLI